MNNYFNLLIQHGSQAISFSKNQECMRFVSLGSGVIAYRERKLDCLVKRNEVSVLGDPLAAPKDKAQVLRSFLKKFPHASFYQVTQACMQILVDMGFYATQMGMESTLALPTFNPTWKSHASVKRQLNKSVRQGVMVVEKPLAELDQAQLRSISDAWCRQTVSGSTKQAFLTRPLVLAPEPDVRYFFAFVEEKLVGYRFFYPCYEHGKIVGYYADIYRAIPDAPQGLSYHLMVVAAMQFKQEGVAELKLGLLPFYRSPAQTKESSNWLWQYFFTWCYRRKSVYNMQGLCDFKLRFHGRLTPVYFVSYSRFPFLELFFGMRYTLGSNWSLFKVSILLDVMVALWLMAKGRLFKAA